MVSSTDSVVCDSQITLSSSRMRHVLDGVDPVDQLHMIGSFAGGADDFLVALVADQQDVVVVAGEAPGLVVHLGDQRTGRVDGLQVARGGVRVHRRRDPMRGEDHDGSLGNLVGLLDEHRTRRGQRVDHVPVVHDLVAHVDGGAVLLQRAFDRLDRPVHTRAVATRLRQQHPLAAWHSGYRADRYRSAGNPHVNSRRHVLQGTFRRHGYAISPPSAWS